MSFKDIIMSNPKLIQLFMTKAPASLHEKGGEKLALRVMQDTLSRTKAYPDFLRKKGLDPKSFTELKDFKRLPIMDKKNYIEIYNYEELCLDHKLSSSYTIETSSGYSGKNSYWLRLSAEDNLFPKYLEYAFVQFYGIDKKDTLVIIALALGTWTSGEKMGQALREVARTGKYPLTVMTPGTNAEQIIEIVKNISSKYKQTIIVGYPPFIKKVIDFGSEQNVDWSRLNIKIGLGGEGYSEKWRDNMAKKIGINLGKDLLAISGGYGAADVGMSIGREYPFTVAIRRLCEENPEITKDIFGKGIPNLFQYSPSSYYIEEINGELIFTAMTGIPLVRYNIHDRGGVIPYDKMISVLQKHGYSIEDVVSSYGFHKEDVWKLPFFYCYGRSDGTVLVGGANVYVEHMESIISTKEEINSFKMTTEIDDKQSNRLVLHLEVDASFTTEANTSELAEIYRNLIIEKLSEINSEYRVIYQNNPEVADPIVRIHLSGEGPFRDDEGKIKKKYRV